MTKHRTAAISKLEEMVILMCGVMGCGRVMQIAADTWAKTDPEGALTVGPPRSVNSVGKNNG